MSRTFNHRKPRSYLYPGAVKAKGVEKSDTVSQATRRFFKRLASKLRRKQPIEME